MLIQPSCYFELVVYLLISLSSELEVTMFKDFITLISTQNLFYYYE